MRHGYYKHCRILFGLAILVLVCAVSATPAAAQSITFAGADANGNGDLTCSEARRAGLRLPATRGSQVYAWLQRGRRSDSDNDGVACEGSGGSGGSASSSGPLVPRTCPVDAEVWRGLKVCQEPPRRQGYNRPSTRTPHLEASLLASLPAGGPGRRLTPYTCHPVRADGSDTDIEHIVALAEAWDSGATPAVLDRMATDALNLTVATPEVNRGAKRDLDAGQWYPAQNAPWFAARVVEVKQRYGLSVDPAEKAALERLLAGEGSNTVSCPGGR